MYDSGAEPEMANDRRVPPGGDAPVVLRLVREADAEVPVAQAVDGAPEAELSPVLEDIVRRFGTFIRRTAHRHRLAASDIEDVVQETRIRLWKALGSSDRIAGASATYIHRTAMSAALDFLRRRRARREEPLITRDIDGVGTFPLGVVSPYDAERHVNTSDVETAVARAVDLLVESRRAVVRIVSRGLRPRRDRGVVGVDRSQDAKSSVSWVERSTRHAGVVGLRPRSERMNDASLRDAYERALQARASGDAAAAPRDVPLERVEALIEGTGSDSERLRTLDALLASSEGRRELDVLWAASRAASPREAARHNDSRAYRSGRWRQYAVAATLVCAAGLSGVWWRTSSMQPDAPAATSETLRGDDNAVQLIAPRKGTLIPATGTQFVWRSVARADRYMVVLVDRTGREAFSMNTTDTTLTLPDTARLTPGTEYLWWVQAAMPDGSTVSATTQSITVGSVPR